MKVSKEILNQAYALAALRDVAENYKHKGFEVEFEKPVGSFVADMVARKNDQVIVFEVKLLGVPYGNPGTALKEYVEQVMRAKFHLVMIRPQPEKHLHLEGIEELLKDYLLHHRLTELEKEAPAYQVENVRQIELDDLEVKHDGTRLKGGGFMDIFIPAHPQWTTDDRDSVYFEFDAIVSTHYQPTFHQQIVTADIKPETFNAGVNKDEPDMAT